MSGIQLNMANGIREFGRNTPAKTAIIDGDRTYTFAELDERSNRFAQALLARGVKQGDTVALLSGNRGEYFEISAGLAKAGIAMVPLNSKNSASDNAYIVGHSEARVLVLEDELHAQAASFLDTLDLVVSFGGQTGEEYETFIATGDPVDPLADVDENDTFCITYTSGTTGRPKGVILTHRGRVLTVYCAAMEYGYGPGRHTIAVAPLYHGAGFAFSYGNLLLGGSVSILRRWNPEAFLQMMVDDRCNTVFLVPTHAQQIRRVCETPAQSYDLSALDTLYFNAAALPVALKQWVLQAFPGVGVHELYGSTECSIVTNLRPEFALERAGSVGQPWFMNEVKLVDDDGNEVPPGVPGELYARSPLLLGGYLKNEEATQESYDADGFFTVGDVAVRDEDGFISIVDRKKDMIIAGGVNIFPREIEEVIAGFGPIDDVAVIGVPDEVYGERIAAYVVNRPGEDCDMEALAAYVKDNVAKYKIPREWYVVAELPRNAGGKILKRQIRDDHIAALQAEAR
ncbi:class I adenylate-forming enzyme family protein [Aeromicrobium wangtongii]|uniref:class I adenylate-forming enzyme family protein n=1 Tax=Aeromicrobium wangtongii TaxID=2969247 RepID=UPI0020175AA5|nr:AMP-binding protein [Aeromicrobium wangtongii]MCL3819610.1 AMP-binding protein [Aeromicrobium wangtongii]